MLKDNDGNTALMYASEGGHNACKELLIKRSCL